MGRSFVIALGIALSFAGMMYFMARALSPEPVWEAYQIANYSVRYGEADRAGRRALAAERAQRNRAYLEARKAWSRQYFIITVPLALLAMLVGGIIRKNTAAAGLMAGALILLATAYVQYWNTLSAGLKASVLALVLAMLVVFSYRKLEGIFDNWGGNRRKRHADRRHR